MAVVYLHKRNDTNEVFYVGIGKTPSRAFTKNNRNKHWHRVVEKYGYTIDVKVNDATYDEAIEIEKYLIAFYGRKDLGLGSLVNMTDGGEGSLGCKNMLGKTHSVESIQKMSEAQKGDKNHMFGKPGTMLGKKQSPEHIAKQTASRNPKGYYFANKKYKAQIKVGEKRIHLGTFNTTDEARDAYINAKKIYHIYE